LGGGITQLSLGLLGIQSVRSCARHHKTPASTKTNWEQEKPIANPLTNLGVKKQVFFGGGGELQILSKMSLCNMLQS